MSQLDISYKESREIMKRIREISKANGYNIIRKNTLFWIIINKDKIEGYIGQKETNDYYGVSNGTRLYQEGEEWKIEEYQTLRDIREGEHKELYFGNKKVYVGCYEKEF